MNMITIVYLLSLVTFILAIALLRYPILQMEKLVFTNAKFHAQDRVDRKHQR